MLEPWSPLGGRLGVVLGSFVLLTIILHVVFVYWRPQSKRWWKCVDYVWLGFATLGIIGAVAEVRKSAATSQLGIYQDLASHALSDVHKHAEFLSQSPGAVCRTFTRSEYSPPAAEFQRIQQEYNEVCNWARKTVSSLPREASTPPSILDTGSLPQRPAITEPALVDMTDYFYHQIDSYNTLVQTVRGLATSSKRDDIEWTLVVLGPFLLATALAIRLTKVTGELRYES